MSGRGRNPFTTTDATPYGVPVRRVAPPTALDEVEREHFLALVNNCPATQFQPQDLPLMVRWAELSAIAERAAGELRTRDLVTIDPKTGREVLSPWFAIHERATKGLVALSMRLRISPQGRSPTTRAPKTKAGRMSMYELLDLEEESAKQ
jgi:hypothetical protein